MPALVIEGEWYDRLASTAYWEVEFERFIAEAQSLLFPAFHFVRFRPTVVSEEGSAQADFALVERDYRSWWVVEVELAHHSLAGHVLPQVTVLARARYGAPEAQYLARQSGELDLAKLEQMMKGAQPTVLVIVNAPVPTWNSSLRPLDATIVVVEVYRSSMNRHCLRIDGVLPRAPSSDLSRCYPDPMVPRLLVVESPGALPIHRGALEIEIDGNITMWDLVTAKDKVWLTPVKGNPLVGVGPFFLTKAATGRLRLSGTSH